MRHITGGSVAALRQDARDYLPAGPPRRQISWNSAGVSGETAIGRNILKSFIIFKRGLAFRSTRGTTRLNLATPQSLTTRFFSLSAGFWYGSLTASSTAYALFSGAVW